MSSPTAAHRSIALAEPSAPADVAHRHFSARLAVECDAADVAADLRAGATSYTILDVRSRASFDRGHIPGAISLPPSQIDAAAAAALPDGPIVVYCWGPGCNGAHRAGALLSGFGRQVKEMLGGFGYWVREGQPVEGTGAAHLATLAERALVG